MSWLEIVVAIGVVGFVIYQQVAGQAVQGRRLIVLPAVLTVVGFLNLHAAKHLHPADIVWLTVGAIGSLLIGLAFGAITRLQERNGALWAQLPLRGLWLWVGADRLARPDHGARRQVRRARRRVDHPAAVHARPQPARPGGRDRGPGDGGRHPVRAGEGRPDVPVRRPPMAAAATARRDTSPMTTRAYWLIRYSGFAVVGIAALVNPPHQPHEQLFRAIQIACFSAAGLALLGWLVVDEAGATGPGACRSCSACLPPRPAWPG